MGNGNFKRQRDIRLAQIWRTWLRKIWHDEAEAASSANDLAKTRDRISLMHSTSSVDGTVQQHAGSDVVSLAQITMTIVPSSQQLILCQV